MKTNYPLLTYNYKVSIGKDTLSFSEVSGLSISYDKIVYKHGLSFLTGPVIARGQKHQGTVSLRRGLAADRNELYAWLEDKSFKDIYIDLCDETGNAVVRWELMRALPLKLDAPQLSARSAEVVIESLEVIVTDLKIKYLQ